MAHSSTPRGPVAMLVASVALAACSGNAETTDPAGPASASIATTTTATTTTTAPATTAPATTEAPTTTEAPAVVGDPVVARVLVGEFDEPIDLAVRPGDHALWVVEQSGRVVRADGPERSTALDLRGRISTGGEQGVLGLAFAPGGDLAYVDFTDADGVTTIAEYPVTDDATFDTRSERILLQVPQPYSNHNAGDLAFGPDAMLYVTLGDGGSGGDPDRNGADPDTLLGSLLRIDPTPDGDRPYTIPPDNPFASGEFEGITGAPEVWAWGLRNPWKIAFDPVTDELWIADVGQNEFEEIDVVGPTDDIWAGRGADFGWSAFEGAERFNTDVADSGRTTAPVLTYSHADGCSISGGVPYRGTAIPELAPAYVYGDYCAGTIWALDLAGQRNLTLLDGFDSVAAVRAGPDGELYVLQRSGAVYRLVAG
jgi:glucose/arabinose dehydrogenase